VGTGARYFRIEIPQVSYARIADAPYEVSAPICALDWVDARDGVTSPILPQEAVEGIETLLSKFPLLTYYVVECTDPSRSAS
jgi:hypothetical protein